MKVPNSDFAALARAGGLAVMTAGDNVVRLLPPLNVSREEVREAIAILDRTAAALEPQKAAAQ
jgi:acetylornithine/N-succinyldiaminopimelate aminotransferase